MLLSKLPLRWIFKITGIPAFFKAKLSSSSLINRSFYAWRDYAWRIVSNSNPIPPPLSFFSPRPSFFEPDARETQRPGTW